jgi:LysM repeat protein
MMRYKPTIILIIILLLVGVSASLMLAQDDTTESEGRPPGGSYVIQPRDILEVLGQKWNVSVQALEQANDITVSTILRVGDTLIIPSDAPPYGEYPAIYAATTDETSGQGGGGGIVGDEYVVQIRDTLDGIAQAFDVSAVSLRLANNIVDTRRIMAGQVLIIPADAPPYGMFPALDSEGKLVSTTDNTLGQGGGGNTYAVQIGDTVDGIAAKFDIQMACLVETNEMANSWLIYAGDTLVLDMSCPHYDGFDVPGERP